MNDRARRVNPVYPWDNNWAVANKIYEDPDGSHVIMPVEDYKRLLALGVDRYQEEAEDDTP